MSDTTTRGAKQYYETMRSIVRVSDVLGPEEAQRMTQEERAARQRRRKTRRIRFAKKRTGGTAQT